MTDKVRLFIGNQELEFTSTPAVLYNYDLDDVSNPTAVKNGYTKTVAVEGTQRNNQIFSNMWNLTRTQETSSFNPSKRVPFSLYINGELYETGYVRLDTIVKNGKKVTYNITLFGSIGDFLYSLSQSESGNELKLRDMAYIAKGSVSGDPTSELDFTINKEAVNEAWEFLAGRSNDTKWGVINFMPCYNGYPDSLDNDKVLINTSGYTGSIRVHTGSTTTTRNGFPTTMSGSTYQTVDGYALGTINGRMTEWDMRDLRSYMQRPVLKFSKFLEACCDPTQNGGYEVELDTDFFNASNPYYNQAYITLPLLSDLKYDEQTSQEWDVVVSGWTTYNGFYNTVYNIAELSDRGGDVSAMEVTFRPKLSLINVDDHSATTADWVSTRTRVVINNTSRYDSSGFVFQLVGYDNQDNVVAGSDTYMLTSDVNGYLNLNDTRYSYWMPWSNSAVYYRLGNFYKESPGIYRWGEDITLKMNTVGVKIAKVKLYATMVADIENDSYGYRRNRLYSSTIIRSEAQYSAYTKYAQWVPPTFDGVVYYTGNDNIKSGSKVTKQVLLNTDGTPCEYLVGYLKTFGLHLWKDPIRKKIQILTRGNFYNAENVVDWSDRIDGSNDLNITPLTFKNKWYSFNYTQKDNSIFEDKYIANYSDDYGIEKVNTGYEFDSETNDLLKGIVYNNASEGTKKSPYFGYRYYNGNECPNFLYSWVQYTLVNPSNDDEYTFDVTGPVAHTDYNYSDAGDMYDMFPKVAFEASDGEPLDGVGCFVFYRGMQSTLINANAPTNVPYWITDDVGQMLVLNDNSVCWLWTNIEYDSKGKRIAYKRTTLPSFGRYWYSNNYINYAWDFGKVKELYVPGKVYLENANIYDSHWKKYINDLFDINTRAVDVNVILPKVQGGTLLRGFYWFNNAVWRINKIYDWNVCDNNPTKVQFIKVQDVQNYTQNTAPIVPTGDTLYITLSGTPMYAPSSGGVVNFTVVSNRPWKGDTSYTESWVQFSNNFYMGTNPSGETTFTATLDAFDPQYGEEQRTFPISIITSDNQRKTFYFRQLAPNIGYLTITPSILEVGPEMTGATLTLTFYGKYYSTTLRPVRWSAETSERQIVNWSTPSLVSTGDTMSVWQSNILITKNEGDERNTYIEYILSMYSGITASAGTQYPVTIGIYQEASTNPSVTTSPNALVFPATGATSAFTITASTQQWRLDWPSFLGSVSPTEGTSGVSVVTVVADPNYSTNNYSNSIDIWFGGDGNSSTSVAVTQPSGTPIFSVTRLDSGNVPASGGSAVYRVISTNYPISGETNVTTDICNLSSYAWTESVMDVTATVATNTAYVDRTIAITFRNASGEAQLMNLTQNAAVPTQRVILHINRGEFTATEEDRPRSISWEVSWQDSGVVFMTGSRRILISGTTYYGEEYEVEIPPVEWGNTRTIVPSVWAHYFDDSYECLARNRTTPVLEPSGPGDTYIYVDLPRVWAARPFVPDIPIQQ